MKKVIYSIVVTIYAIIAVFTTVCLLSYNDYKVTQFGDYSLVIVSGELAKDNVNLNEGDLVIVNKKGDIKVGDQVFYYSQYEKTVTVASGKVTNIEKITSTETTYTIGDNYMVSSQYILGPVNGTTKVQSVGTVLNVLESQWGFLFLVVFPSLLAFIYELTVVVGEIKGNKSTKEGK